MNNKLSERLRQIRIQQGGYQKELAYHLRVSVGTISNYENGVHDPDLDSLGKIAQYYGVSTDYLIGLTDCRYSVNTFNRVIFDGYTVGRLLELLDRLDPEAKAYLFWMLRRLG